MPTPTIPAPRRDPHPPTRFTPPPDACDAHCHIFGPAHRFPFAPDRTYTPPDSGLDEFVDLQGRLGLSRAVFVQASCHGTDNRAMLHALESGAGRYAGVAMIDDTHTDDDLAMMHRLGVRGIRFNFVSHLGGAPDRALFERLAERIYPLGWHLDLHFDARDLAGYAALFDALPMQFIIDHMARVPVADGIEQEPFRFLLELVSSNQRAWVKISGAERLTAGDGPPYDDVVPLARALVEAAPDRVLWGTDWPHPNVSHMPDDADLLDLLSDFTPDETTRNRVLVDNPATLYDFA
ncbi:MAG TPA: amidohydrolase family protein [Acidimicrobiia bacterium]|nr:amidohydrolase family protein [Acidimicrobiia bacterium]